MKTARDTAIICLVVAGIIGLLYFFFLSRIVILYILIAVLFTIAIQPLVIRLQRWRVKKAWAIIWSDLFILLIVLGLISTIIIPLLSDGINFIQNIPSLFQSILSQPALASFLQSFHIDTTNVVSFPALSTIATIGSIAGIIISIFSTVGILLVMTILLQFEGENIWNIIVKLFPEKQTAHIHRVSDKIAKVVGGYVSGNLLISVIAGVVTYILLLLLGVPYKLSLSAFVALLDLVPLIGAAIATVLVGLIALTKSFSAALIAFGVLIAYQILEGHVIQPLIYSRSIKLSALIIVIASILGAKIGGVVGILLGIPVAAIIQIIVVEIYTLRRS